MGGAVGDAPTLIGIPNLNSPFQVEMEQAWPPSKRTTPHNAHFGVQIASDLLHTNEARGRAEMRRCEGSRCQPSVPRIPKNSGREIAEG
jgi:hypothetical protein